MVDHQVKDNAPLAEQKVGALHGIRVLDLSRILAGPTCTQLLGDLGADIIKVERPKRGDDTRAWGPPFAQVDGEDSSESAYYLSANRNKRSLTVDISKPEGIALIKKLAKNCDILVENFKVGDLAKKGLDYKTLAAANPSLIYCSISGFGQTGPYAHRAGYDFLIQGMGGIMSLTGLPDEEGGTPMKAGVGIADVMCGMYASNAILAALHAKTHTGRGQHIDLSLLDSQVAWLINQGVGYLTDGNVPPRRGNAHPVIVPYETFPASDKPFILAVGNDDQCARFLEYAGYGDLMQDERMATNSARVRNRKWVVETITAITKTKPAATWLQALEERGVPSGPVNSVKEVFEDPQVQHREMQLTMPHDQVDKGEVNLIANPIKLSDTPVTYRTPPPQLGEHNADILKDILAMSDDDISALTESGALG